jgi:hypothetical protein
LSAWTQNQERVKMWLDNTLLIDQWSSLDSMGAGASAVSLAQDSLYKIQVLYKRGAVASGGHGARMVLQWSSSSSGDTSMPCGGGSTSKTNIPSHRLWSASRIAQEDSSGMLEVMAGGSSSKACIAFGTGLTEATAGVASHFKVRARDAVGNVRGLHQDDWIVSLVPSKPSAFAQSSLSPLDTHVQVQGVVYADTHVQGDYRVSYTATRSGDYALSVLRPLP